MFEGKLPCKATLTINAISVKPATLLNPGTHGVLISKGMQALFAVNSVKLHFICFVPFPAFKTQ